MTTLSAVLLNQWFSGVNQARSVPNLCITPLAKQAVEAVLPSIEAYQRGDQTWPLLLPWITNEAVSWYACAYEAAQGRELQSLLTAWVGPSWSDFAGQPADLDVTQPR